MSTEWMSDEITQAQTQQAPGHWDNVPESRGGSKGPRMIQPDSNPAPSGIHSPAMVPTGNLPGLAQGTYNL